MPIPYDPEVGLVLAAAAAQAADAPVAARGDALNLRAITDETMRVVYGSIEGGDGVSSQDFGVAADDGTTITARWYTPATQTSGNAVVYAHGGGMVCGSVDIYDQMLRSYCASSGVPFLSVDYRLAPEHSGDRLARDVFCALEWLVSAADLEVDSGRIAVMGDSGGGGVAAGTAILARNAGIPLARQILVYPMLDHRNTTPDPELAATATWTYDNNYTGWNALLPNPVEADILAVASPSTLGTFEGLAPAYIEVGELDIFRDESIAYAQGLYTAGVSCELHVHPGAPHAFERLAPTADVSIRALGDRLRAIRSL